MKINAADLPIEIEGGDESQIILVVKDVNGNVAFSIQGDGSIVSNTTPVVAAAPQAVDDAANVAAVITALKAQGIFVDPP